MSDQQDANGGRNLTPLAGWRVVLVSPQTSENVGAVARIMNNFGCGELVVTEPRCDIAPSGRAGVMACWSEEILSHARTAWSLDEAIADCQFSIGLVMSQSEDRPVDFSGFVPRAILQASQHATKRALVFGREDRGLTNEECSRLTARWSIPTNPAAPSLNLAQAVAIAFAGIAEGTVNSSESPGSEEPASQADIDGLMNHTRQLLEAIGYERGIPNDQTIRLLRRAALRAQLRLNEIRTLRGICRRAINELLGYERRK